MSSIPGSSAAIEVKSDGVAPSRVKILNSTDVTDRASAARVIAGLDVEVVTNTETRGVDIASDSVVNDDADQGVVPFNEDDKPPELATRYKMIVIAIAMMRKSAIAIAMVIAMAIAMAMKREIMSTMRNSMRTVLAMKYQMCPVPCRKHVVAGPSDRQII